MVDLIVGQGRGGLVQDQELCVGIQGAADLQQLLFAGFQLADHGIGINVHAQLLEKLLGLCQLLLIVQQAEPGQFAAEEDIVRHRQIVYHIQLLMDKGDACGLHLVDGGRRIAFAAKDDLARISRDNAGEDVHQGGFSRAVFAQQSVDLALAHRQVDIGKRPAAAERLGHVIHFKDVHMCCLLASGWETPYGRSPFEMRMQGRKSPCIRANGRSI